MYMFAARVPHSCELSQFDGAEILESERTGTNRAHCRQAASGNVKRTTHLICCSAYIWCQAVLGALAPCSSRRKTSLQRVDDMRVGRRKFGCSSHVDGGHVVDNGRRARNREKCFNLVGSYERSAAARDSHGCHAELSALLT